MDDHAGRVDHARRGRPRSDRRTRRAGATIARRARRAIAPARPAASRPRSSSITRRGPPRGRAPCSRSPSSGRAGGRSRSTLGGRGLRTPGRSCRRASIARRGLAGAHGSRTHRVTSSVAPPVLKTGGPTGTPPLPRAAILRSSADTQRHGNGPWRLPRPVDLPRAGAGRPRCPTWRPGRPGSRCRS